MNRTLVLLLGVDKLLEYYEKEKKTDEAESVGQGVHDVTLKENIESAAESDKEATNSSKDKGDRVEEQANVNITDEEKERLVATSPTTSAITVIDQPFLETIYEALDCTENDYATLFALSLLYAMSNNSGKLK